MRREALHLAACWPSAVKTQLFSRPCEAGPPRWCPSLPAARSSPTRAFLAGAARRVFEVARDRQEANFVKWRSSKTDPLTFCPQGVQGSFPAACQRRHQVSTTRARAQALQQVSAAAPRLGRAAVGASRLCADDEEAGLRVPIALNETRPCTVCIMLLLSDRDAADGGEASQLATFHTRASIAGPFENQEQQKRINSTRPHQAHPPCAFATSAKSCSAPTVASTRLPSPLVPASPSRTASAAS